MKKQFRVTANAATKPVTAASRGELMDEISEMYETRYPDLGEVLDNILDNNNASEDDSDPNEGFFVTMSDEDLKKARDEFKNAIESHDPVDTYTFELSNKELKMLQDAIQSYRPYTQIEVRMLPNLISKICGNAAR